MSILGREAEAFVRSQSERTMPLLGKYVTKVPARVESVTGVPPDQKAVVATPDQIAALASGEITSIPRPAMPVYGSVEPGDWVWCLADGAGLHIMGTPGSSEGTGGGGSGTPGKDGKTVLNGAGAPASSVGVAGDFYVDTQNSRFYGPKATNTGAWPTTFITLLGRGVPAGGTTGQVLTKVDADDYDTRWSDPTGGTGGGGMRFESENRSVYVATTGNDTTGDGTQAKPWKTIQRAINDCAPLFAPLTGISFYRIVLSPGIYVESPIIPANQFAAFNANGNGGVWIVSSTGVATDVTIRSSSAAGVDVFGSSTLEGLTIENDSNAVLVRGGWDTMCYVRDCVLRRLTNADGVGNAIQAQIGSVVSRGNSTTTGRRFSAGLTARYGSVIAKFDSAQPTGYTTNEEARNGGAVR